MTETLFHDVLLDHGRRPRSTAPLAAPTHEAADDNPACGDSCAVTLRIVENRIAEIAITPTGCVISKAAASLMAEVIRDTMSNDAQLLKEQFATFVANGTEPPHVRLAPFGGIHHYPARVRCALLPWQILAKALEPNLTDRVWQQLRTVMDPELHLNIVDLGLIYDVTIHNGIAQITMTLTTPFCPVAESFPTEVERAARAVNGVREAVVTLTFDPPWTPARLSPHARLVLGPHPETRIPNHEPQQSVADDDQQ